MSLAVMLSALLLQAQVADSIAARMALQRYTFPQEKVHVMTDKPRYMAGDTIWLRAWVVDASTHRPVNASQFVYVELQNPLDTVVTRIKLRQRAGVFSGHIALSPEMAEGAYQLSAYTMFMQSVGEAYFFKRRLEVTSPLATRYAIRPQMQWDDDELYMTLRLEDRHDGTLCKFHRMGYVVAGGNWHRRMSGEGDVRLRLKGKELHSSSMLVAFDNYKKYITLPRRGGDYDLTFYPEGGYLVPGQPCSMSFKSLSSDGTAAVVTGRVVDQTGHEVATLSTLHDGMGLLRFTPRSGMSYTAHVTDTTGHHKQFVLPQVHDHATVLHLDREGDSTVTVRAVGHDAAQGIIVLQQRGNVLAVGQGELTLDTRQMPAGVVQCLLLDDRWRRLSERLFFARGRAAGQTTITTDRDSYGSRELVSVGTAATGYAAPQGDYAVSVTDDRSVALDSASAICVDLLLQSELAGRINNPAYYFVDDSPQRAAALDLLLMTQGWRRYDVSQALRGHLAEPQYPIERSQVVSGRVVSEWRKSPLADASVVLLAPGIRRTVYAQTDSLGYFALNLANFPDSTRCVVQAFNKKGKKEMNLMIDPVVFPTIDMTRQPVSLMSKQSHDEDYIDAEMLRANTIDGMRNIILREVTVTANRVKLPEDIYEAMARMSIGQDRIRSESITTFNEVFRKFPGILIRNGNLFCLRTRDWRNPNGKIVPFMIDGVVFNSVDNSRPASIATQDAMGQSERLEGSPYMEVEIYEPLINMVENMIPFDVVKRIDYLDPTQSLVFGSHSGLVVIQTKDGSNPWSYAHKDFFMQKINPLGFQKPADFYSPRYDRGDCGIEPGTDQRNTLYWNPSVKVGDDGKAAFDFYANDLEGTTYTVTIEGITADGQLIHTRHTITKK